MSSRLEYLACYVGSAAAVAFLAACVDAPRVVAFTCDTPPGESVERCVPLKADAADPEQLAVALAP